MLKKAVTFLPPSIDQELYAYLCLFWVGSVWSPSFLLLQRESFLDVIFMLAVILLDIRSLTIDAMPRPSQAMSWTFPASCIFGAFLTCS